MPTQPYPGLTFEVDPVTPGCKRLPEMDAVSRLQLQTKSCVIAISEPDVSVTAYGVNNALIDAVRHAYAQHLPLVLSPDDIWLTIAQGFGHHILQNEEQFRGRLVRHQGKKKLDVVATHWAKAIDLCSSEIRAATDPVIHETLLCDFSTTTPAVRIASEAVLMNTYAAYFTYGVSIICGIPRITLQGTPGDWRRIRDRVEVLGTFELGPWVRRLRPILDEFISTAEGSPASSFWSSIYTAEPLYGGPCMPLNRVTGEKITGWIADLFPYLGSLPRMRSNPALAQCRIGWTQPRAGVNPKDFPSGLCEVDVDLTTDDGPELVKLRAGFLGVRQNATDLAVAPVIGWAVTCEASKKEVHPSEEQLQRKARVPALGRKIQI